MDLVHIAAMLYLNKWVKTLCNRIWYNVSIISDCFFVCSLTIDHILQSNGNRNKVGLIRHVSSFHLEPYNKMIKIVCYVIHMLKAETWSTWNFSKNILNYQYSKKSQAWKKLKNNLADCPILKCHEKVLQNFSGLTMISSCYWKPCKT